MGVADVHIQPVTHRFPVARAAAAWERIFSKREHVLGVILDWPAAGEVKS